LLGAGEQFTGDAVAGALLPATGGDARSVPKWGHSDFDSLYVVKLVPSGAGRKASFTLMHEGLDGQPTTCP